MITTKDGYVVREGDRVFNYYDQEWGEVGTAAHDGWFIFNRDGGGECLLNGERIVADPFSPYILAGR